MATFISAAIASAQALLTGLLLFYLQRRQRMADDKALAVEASRRKQEETRDQRRQRAELLQLALISANNDLGYAVAMAVKRGHANGEVEKAIAAYETAKREYYAFLNEQAVDNLHQK